MGLSIIVRDKRSEAERRKAESAVQILKHYHEREIAQGSRFRIKSDLSKERVKKLYDEIRDA